MYWRIATISSTTRQMDERKSKQLKSIHARTHTNQLWETMAMRTHKYACTCFQRSILQHQHKIETYRKRSEAKREKKVKQNNEYNQVNPNRWVSIWRSMISIQHNEIEFDFEWNCVRAVLFCTLCLCTQWVKAVCMTARSVYVCVCCVRIAHLIRFIVSSVEYTVASSESITSFRMVLLLPRLAFRHLLSILIRNAPLNIFAHVHVCIRESIHTHTKKLFRKFCTVKCWLLY